MSPRIVPDLVAAGIPAQHVQGLGLKGASDPTVFASARELGYDAVVTKDRYRQPEERLASLRAMRADLRIVRLTFSPEGPVRDIDANQLALILARRGEIERVIEPDSGVRLLVLNANTGGVTNEQSLDQVVEELRRREQPGEGRTASR